MAAKHLSPKAFVSHASGPKGGAWLVYGVDEYIKTETARLATRAFIGASDPRFAVTHLVGGQTDADEIMERARVVPMLGEKSAVVVHELHKLAPTHKTRLATLLESVPDSCLLICQGPAEPDRRTRIYQWFMEAGRDVACDPLTPAQAEAFARRRLEEHGASASADVLARLLSRTGQDAGMIARETEKLALFCEGVVTSEAVDIVAGLAAGCTPEDLVKSLVQGRMPESLAQARRMREAGMDAISLVGKLSGHLFDLRRAAGSRARQSGPLSGALRVSRLRAEELLSWLSNGPAEHFERALQDVAQADRLMRSGTADADLVCDQLILSLAGIFASRRARAA